MEKIFEVFKEFENQGFTIECGVKEKKRKKEMSEAIKKIKESGDEKKIKYVKNLSRYYGILYNMGIIINNTEFYLVKEDKYGSECLYHYLDNSVDTAKRSIAGVMTALANDEPLDPFFKYLMFSDLYPLEEKKD